MHSTVHVWRSEDDLVESALSLPFSQVLGIEFRGPGLVARASTHWVILLALFLHLNRNNWRMERERERNPPWFPALRSPYHPANMHPLLSPQRTRPPNLSVQAGELTLCSKTASPAWPASSPSSPLVLSGISSMFPLTACLCPSHTFPLHNSSPQWPYFLGLPHWSPFLISPRALFLSADFPQLGCKLLRLRPVTFSSQI